MLAIVAGLAAAGAVYGPTLVERYRGDDGEATSTDPDAAAETAAPLQLPAAPLTPPIVRTATFTVSDESATGVDTMRVTADFDTAVVRTVLEQPSGSIVEVLAAFDQAVVRPSDAPVWYIMNRGQFPFDGGLQRAAWVPTLEELVPPEQRASAVVTSATFATIGEIPTTHLVIDLAGEQLEVWVEQAGIVRQQVTTTAIGRRTVTVQEVSAESWIPEFPAPDQTQPITASALATLGI
jgi:hypothetical protein